MNKLFKIAVLALFLAPFSVLAADEVEEVVVTGSQIKGSKITGALPVSVISNADI